MAGGRTTKVLMLLFLFLLVNILFIHCLNARFRDRKLCKFYGKISKTAVSDLIDVSSKIMYTYIDGQNA